LLDLVGELLKQVRAACDDSDAATFDCEHFGRATADAAARARN
jgi:hypothetical protein